MVKCNCWILFGSIFNHLKDLYINQSQMQKTNATAKLPAAHFLFALLLSLSLLSFHFYGNLYKLSGPFFYLSKATNDIYCSVRTYIYIFF